MRAMYEKVCILLYTPTSPPDLASFAAEEMLCGSSASPLSDQPPVHALEHKALQPLPPPPPSLHASLRARRSWPLSPPSPPPAPLHPHSPRPCSAVLSAETEGTAPPTAHREAAAPTPAHAPRSLPAPPRRCPRVCAPCPRSIMHCPEQEMRLCNTQALVLRTLCVHRAWVERLVLVRAATSQVRARGEPTRARDVAVLALRARLLACKTAAPPPSLGFKG